jgi:hypothetical protein
MKPKAATEHEDGLLEYLEDIIGTSGFKEPIDEALVEIARGAPREAQPSPHCREGKVGPRAEEEISSNIVMTVLIMGRLLIYRRTIMRSLVLVPNQGFCKDGCAKPETAYKPNLRA